MKNILVTGGVGFIGYHLIRELLKKKFNIFIYDNLIRGKFDKDFKLLLNNKNCKFIKKDLNKKIIIKKKFDYIFHLAATVGVKNVNCNPIETFSNNTNPLMNILNGLNKNNNKNLKIIFFSTSEVYSPLIGSKKYKFPYKENEEIQIENRIIPRNSYYLSKLFCEKIIQMSGYDYLILRPHNIYGPRMGFSHVVPELIKKFNEKKNIKVYSHNHTRSFCFIDDAILQIIKLSFNKKFYNQTFNIGNDKEEIKIMELAKKIAKIKNSKKKLVKMEVTPGSPNRRCPNINKIKKLIKLKKFINLSNGLKQTINWYEKI